MGWSFLYIQILISIAIALGVLVLTIIDILPLRVLIGLIPILIGLAILRNSIDKRTNKKPKASTNKLPYDTHPKINERTCDWIQKPGIWKHKITGIHYCSYCAPNPSPLSAEDDEGWFCHKCKNSFGGVGAFSIDY